MKVCMIGSTGHFNHVPDGIMGYDDVCIAGVAPGSEGEDIDRLYTKVSKQGHTPQRFDDYIEMLDRIKPDIAAVACYFGDHAKVVVEALKRSCHVFVEKPVATTPEDLEAVKNAYMGAGVHLAAMLTLRCKPWFLTAQKAVREGAIGNIRLMNAQKSYKLGSRGAHFKRRETYGGTIPWVGSHAIDWLYWFSGEKFKSVFACQSAKNNQNHGDLETSALCQFTLSNEVSGSVSIDYFRPENAPGHSDDRIRLVGTRGIIEVREEKVYLLGDKTGGIEELPLLPEKKLFTDFLMQVRGEGRCMVSAEESFYITEACLKARCSADENRIIYFD